MENSMEHYYIMIFMKQTTKKNNNVATKKPNVLAPQKNAGNKQMQKNAGNNEEEEHGSLLEKFLGDQLKDIYYAEQAITKALPKMQEACTTEELKEAFGDHLYQTSKQIKRLEKVFQKLGMQPEGKKCEAIDGIIKEAENIISETKEGTMTRDAALIIAAQKVEHYEIATYGGLVQLAITVGQHEAADLLDKTLNEEEETDLHLTDIAESFINIEAEEEEKYSWNKMRQEEETEEEVE